MKQDKAATRKRKCPTDSENPWVCAEHLLLRDIRRALVAWSVFLTEVEREHGRLPLVLVRDPLRYIRRIEREESNILHRYSLYTTVLTDDDVVSMGGDGCYVYIPPERGGSALLSGAMTALRVATNVPSCMKEAWQLIQGQASF